MSTLNVKSSYTPPPSIKLHELDSEPAQLICRVVRKLFSMALTKETVAQIIDNMPIKGNYVGKFSGGCMIAHPDIEARSEPSAEASRLASQLCADIDPMTLSVDARAAEMFQNEVQSDSQSVASARRCLEIVSSLVHDITSDLYGKSHPPPEEFEKRNVPLSCDELFHSHECCPEYGRLHHLDYRWYPSFKHSSSSIVGYWAETMIFGGPVLFARGPTGTECSAAFIHPPSGGIAELTDSEVKSLFGLASAGVEQGNDTDIAQPPFLPFIPDDKARRLCVDDAIAKFIYREDGQLNGYRRYLKSINRWPNRKCGNSKSIGSVYIKSHPGDRKR